MVDRIENSILQDVKQAVGQEFDDDTFDVDILMAINAAFFTLNQLGVGPKEGYRVEKAEDKWSDYVGDSLNLEAVKSYTVVRTRLLFDPPTNSFLVEALKSQITEFEWRLNVQVDPGKLS